jgi:hypothetical protein
MHREERKSWPMRLHVFPAVHHAEAEFLISVKRQVGTGNWEKPVPLAVHPASHQHSSGIEGGAGSQCVSTGCAGHSCWGCKGEVINQRKSILLLFDKVISTLL